MVATSILLYCIVFIIKNISNQFQKEFVERYSLKFKMNQIFKAMRNFDWFIVLGDNISNCVWSRFDVNFMNLIEHLKLIIRLDYVIELIERRQKKNTNNMSYQIVLCLNIYWKDEYELLSNDNMIPFEIEGFIWCRTIDETKIKCILIAFVNSERRVPSFGFE